ncbi:MAG: hypothetical protein ACRD19_14980 [Terriglobia bacterium]
MTSDEKLARIEQQMRACEMGLAETIECPYCGGTNREGAALCCNLFAAAALAILDRKDESERADLAARIADQAAKN